MFRFSSEYASVKFRSLSGYRLASLHPAAAARRDGTALSPKWPPVKVPEEEVRRAVRRQGLAHHVPAMTRQPLATSWRARSSQAGYQPDISHDYGCSEGTSSSQQCASTSQRIPTEEVQPPICPHEGNRLINPSTAEGVGPNSHEQSPELTGGDDLDINNYDESILEGTSFNASITATQSNEEAKEDEGCDEVGKGEGDADYTGEANTESRPSPVGRGPGKSTIGGASFPTSLTAPQEELEAGRDENNVKKAKEVQIGTSQSPAVSEQPQSPKTLDMTPGELTTKMHNMTRVAVMSELTGHVKRAAGVTTSKQMAQENGVNTEVIKQNAAKVQQLFSQLRIVKAGPRPVQRTIPVNLTPTSIKLSSTSESSTRPQSSTHQPGSPCQLPKIDKSDLNPVMAKKGKSYSPVKLGKGAFGEVVLMQSRSDGTLLAVKRLTNVQNQQRATEEFTRETQAMNAVSSSSAFPKFLGTVDRYSFAMEFIGSLDKRSSWSAYEMSKKRFKLMKSLDWLKVSIDVTKGLMDMHEAGWTHNDLHNNNVMVRLDPKSQSWEGKIIDLGFASRNDNPAPPVQMTPKQKRNCFKNCAQLAPEIIEGTSPYNQQSDVYSLGQLFVDIAPESRKLSCLKSLGKRCIDKTPDKRPDLEEVLRELTLMYYQGLNKPRKTGTLKTLFQSLKNRFRA